MSSSAHAEKKDAYLLNLQNDIKTTGCMLWIIMNFGYLRILDDTRALFKVLLKETTELFSLTR